MVNILVKLSKYVITLLMAFYTFKCFSVFRHNSDKAKNRIYKEAELIEAGYTIEKIASALFISQSVVSRDMSVRFSVMEPERYENIVKILSENSLNNLYNIKSEGESEKGRKR